MPFEMLDTSQQDLKELDSYDGVNGSMRKVRNLAERLQSTSGEFEQQVQTLKESKLYCKMKELQNSIIN